MNDTNTRTKTQLSCLALRDSARAAGRHPCQRGSISWGQRELALCPHARNFFCFSVSSGSHDARLAPICSRRITRLILVLFAGPSLLRAELLKNALEAGPLAHKQSSSSHKCFRFRILFSPWLFQHARIPETPISLNSGMFLKSYEGSYYTSRYIPL